MAITKAILTGGGRATRLRPITTTLNKHLIPLANKPMIFYAIEKAVEAGIKEIFINTNPGEKSLQAVVGDGSRWGVSITYFEQEGGPQGIAHVVKCAERFIGQDPFMFYLSDNIIFSSLKPLFEKFCTEKLDCLLTLAEVADPTRFGVPQFDAVGKLVDVVEKPAQPPSNYAVTGIYLYSAAFFEAFNQIEKSARGEYEISSIHSYFLKNNFKVGYQEITGWWKDTGKPNDLIELNHLLLDRLPEKEYHCAGSCPSSVVNGTKISTGENMRFGENVQLTGPVIIEGGCMLENCRIGPYVTIGANTVVKNAAICESIIFNNCRIEVPLGIRESIIGKDSVIVPHYDGDFHRMILGDYTLIEI